MGEKKNKTVRNSIKKYNNSSWTKTSITSSGT